MSIIREAYQRMRMWVLTGTPRRRRGMWKRWLAGCRETGRRMSTITGIARANFARIGSIRVCMRINSRISSRTSPEKIFGRMPSGLVRANYFGLQGGALLK